MIVEKLLGLITLVLVLILLLLRLRLTLRLKMRLRLRLRLYFRMHLPYSQVHFQLPRKDRND